MEQKRRGRPPGVKKEIKIELDTNITTEPKKRGRKTLDKPDAVLPDVMMEEEIEGTTIEKLKFLAIQVKQLDKTLDMEPYRMDWRRMLRPVRERRERPCHFVSLAFTVAYLACHQSLSSKLITSETISPPKLASATI